MEWFYRSRLIVKKRAVWWGAMTALPALLVIWLAGCLPAAPVLRTTITPAPGLGVLIGRVDDTGQYWQDEPLYLYAAPFYASEDGRGFFMLEVDRHPHVRLGIEGSFILEDVLPGRYVLVVGPTAQDGRLVTDARQEPLLVSVEPDAVLDLGRVILRSE